MLKSFCIASVIIMFLLPERVEAQGVYRAYGVGFRTSLWKYRDAGDENYQPGIVDNSFGGGMLYFFARLIDKWYLEGNIGGESRNVIKINGVVENISMTSFLAGARYDLLSRNLGSIFQPYLAFGGGMHTITRNIISTSVINKSNAELGAFFGGGLNVILASWFALNADLKYHFITRESYETADLSGLQLGFGLSFMFGGLPELLRIEDINIIVEDIYPAYYEFYATYPLLQVSVKNTAGYTIEVNLHSNIEGYSERPHESGFIEIPSGEIEKIPVYAIFGKKLISTKKREPAVVDFNLEARAGATHMESMSINVMIHSRNAWNGEVNRLSFFLTPDDEELMDLTRGIIDNIKFVDNPKLQKFYHAREIFNKLGETGIGYRSDPNIPYYQDDYVQYAMETIDKKSGDCDDLVILYCSLLESIGIQTAFVDVRDPEKEIAHLYMMFDSGISPGEGAALSSNDKKYIIREQTSGNRSIWIPVEATLVGDGFDSAWNSAATAYIEEGEIRSGIAEGWMQIVDVK